MYVGSFLVGHAALVATEMPAQSEVSPCSLFKYYMYRGQNYDVTLGANIKS